MKNTIRQRIAEIRRGIIPSGYRRTPQGIKPVHWKELSFNDILRNIARKVAKPRTAYWRLGVKSHAKGTFRELVENPETVDMDELYSVQANDLIVNITFAWEHAIAIVNKEDAGLLVSHRFPTYVFNSNVSSEFYKYVITQKWMKKQLDLISPGGAGRNRVMNKSAFLKIPCCVPPLAEQKRIAEILGCCDRVIALKKELIAEKKRQKKALMQKLLNPDSGFRLPGFTGEWKQETLGSLASTKGDYGINAPACSYFPNLPKYIRITDIDDNCKFIKNNNVYVNISDYEDYVLHEGDIVFVRTGGTVGKTYVYDSADGRLVFAGFLIRFGFQKPKADYRFIKQVVSTDDYFRWVNIMSARSGQPGINAEEYASYRFFAPDLKEQYSIADILSTADKEIDLLEQDLAQQLQKKKTLMQLLLTGIVRV